MGNLVHHPKSIPPVTQTPSPEIPVLMNPEPWNADTETATLEEALDIGDVDRVTDHLMQGEMVPGALLRAVQHHHAQMVRVLLAYGASYDEVVEGTTAFRWACQNSLEMATLLVEYGADLKSPDTQGQTPLHWACEAEQYSIIRYLLDFGMQPDQQDAQGDTALIIAARKHHLSAILLLLRRGADPRLVNHQGLSASQMVDEPWLVDLIHSNAQP